MKPLFLAFLFCLGAKAQDERFYRRIFTDELHGAQERHAYKLSVESSAYQLDINRDGRPERLLTAKRDGQDFLQINDVFGNKVFETKLETKGWSSNIYRVQMKTLSANADLLAVYFDEGNSGGPVFQTSARLYLLVIEDRDLAKIYARQGPAFYYEKSKLDFSYVRRHYRVNVVDYNGDGVREVSVIHNDTQRVYFYLGQGRWREL